MVRELTSERRLHVPLCPGGMASPSQAQEEMPGSTGHGPSGRDEGFALVGIADLNKPAEQFEALMCKAVRFRFPIEIVPSRVDRSSDTLEQPLTSCFVHHALCSMDRFTVRQAIVDNSRALTSKAA